MQAQRPAPTCVKHIVARVTNIPPGSRRLVHVAGSGPRTAPTFKAQVPVELRALPLYDRACPGVMPNRPRNAAPNAGWLA